MNYTSMEMQDQFAHILLGNRGTFLDLGSADPIVGNNTASLESIGWSGLAFDSIQHLADAMNNSSRKTPCFCVDVSREDPFVKILLKFKPGKHFNYISLDVDDASVSCLNLLTNNGFTFDVMTFEHDAYLGDETRRVLSREILFDHGYGLLFKDVKTCSKNWSPYGPQCRPCNHVNVEKWEWEDWWVGPRFFHCLGYSASSMAHQDCIKILRNIGGEIKW